MCTFKAISSKDKKFNKILQEQKKILQDLIKLHKQKVLIVAIGLDKNGTIRSTGYNSYTKTHPLQFQLSIKHNEHNKPFVHAEVQCVINAKQKQLSTILVLRVLKDGTWGLAKPCNVCSDFLKSKNIKTVLYSTEDLERETENNSSVEI